MKKYLEGILFFPIFVTKICQKKPNNRLKIGHRDRILVKTFLSNRRLY